MTKSKILEKIKLLKINCRDYRILVAVFSVAITAAIGYFVTFASSTNWQPSIAPADTMKNLEQIYCRLNGSGCNQTAADSYGTDSPAIPAGTMHDLTDVWNASPDFKNSPGDATAADVDSGKTFYANSSTRQTGSLALTGNATTASVSSGYTFYSTSYSKQTGAGGTAVTCKICNYAPTTGTCASCCASYGLTCYGNMNSGSPDCAVTLLSCTNPRANPSCWCY